MSDLYRKCRTCEGAGESWDKPEQWGASCPACGGTGMVEVEPDSNKAARMLYEWDAEANDWTTPFRDLDPDWRGAYIRYGQQMLRAALGVGEADDE